MLPNKEPLNSFAPDSSLTQTNVFGCSSASCISENVASTSKEIPPIASGNIASVEIPGNCNIPDDIFTIEDFFPEHGNVNLVDANAFQVQLAALSFQCLVDLTMMNGFLKFSYCCDEVNDYLCRNLTSSER